MGQKIRSGQIEDTQAWITPSFLNSWVSYDGGASFNNPGYFKDQDGIVYLRGLIKNGTTTYATPMFNLPAGYRPVKQEIFGTTSVDLFGSVRVDTAGNVLFTVGSNSWISLDGLSFKAA